ncbi:MarR family winged helix-turn-helix transcriptional regulator [Solitalea koreensis]|uniref:DNA-binding transcriptional regulator, MarR family n=1 Tax=Solitalea koreensis TaxID=543615 RepID=A0A521DD04_9SPHI|nr:MarR family transcriptional regulator [Solitalea koreensis]SMO69694.1 DNA-binding transcriptional regulator, MarR family [Solitalea koreensis]
MDFHLLKDIIDLMWEFENSNSKSNIFSNDLSGFKQWVIFSFSKSESMVEPDWEGKKNGRSPESVISTFIVHMNRYAKNYSKSAIYGSDFSTQEDFIYLINLKAFGEMTKMELIKKNIQDKPVGMQIINRLISQDWVQQKDSETDKRSKVINITAKGLEALDKQMGKIRQATNIVSGDLTHSEKMELIRLLNKLNDFHHPIYCQNLEPDELLNEALKTKEQ